MYISFVLLFHRRKENYEFKLLRRIAYALYEKNIHFSVHGYK